MGLTPFLSISKKLEGHSCMPASDRDINKGVFSYGSRERDSCIPQIHCSRSIL